MNPEKIKVLQLIETLGRGGAEGLLVCVLKNIDKDKYSPTVGCLSDRIDLKEDLEEAGIPVFCIGLKSLYRWWQGIYRLYRIIKRGNFDIVHTHLFFANLYGRIASKMAGVPHILTTLHNPDYTYEDNGRVTYKARKLIDKYSGRICNDQFLAVSDFVKRDYERHMGFKNIEVLYNCIDITQFERLNSSLIQKKRAELGFRDDEIILLNIGRLHPQKGQIYLIEALNMVRNKNKKCKLLMVGRGHMEAELQNKANKMGLGGYIKFLKDRKDIFEIMHSCDIFVLPSIYEGFGIALVEAMACGMPVVVSDIDTFKEIVRDNVDGMIVEKENPERLAAAISSLMNDSEKRLHLGESAKKKAMDEFDVKVHLKKLENVYQEVTSNNKHKR